MKMLPLLLAFSLSIPAFSAGPGCSSQEQDRALEQLEIFNHYFRNQTLAPNSVIQNLGERLARLNQCPEKVWPGHRISQTPIRMIDKETSAVFQFNSRTGNFDFLRPENEKDKLIHRFDFDKKGDGGITISTLSYVREPPRPDPSQMFCWDENEALMKFIKENRPPANLSAVDKLMGFTAHENFHNVDQDPNNPVHQHAGQCQWAHGGKPPERGIGPGQEQVAFLRQNMISALKKAFDGAPGSKDRKLALAQAKGWMERLQKDHPEALKRLNDVDRGEGTAEYAGMMANVYSRLGCTPSQKTLRADIQEHLNNRTLPMVLGVDQQAYLLGALAGALLDEMGDAEWKDKVTKTNSTPLDMLLAHREVAIISPAAPEADPLLLESQKINQSVGRCMNALAEQAVTKVLDAAEEYALVQLEQAPFGTRGGFIPVNSRGGPAMVSLGTTVMGQQLKVNDADMLGINGLCPGEPHRYVAIPKRLIQSDGTLTPPAEGPPVFSGSVPPPASSKKNWNQVPVLCR